MTDRKLPIFHDVPRRPGWKGSEDLPALKAHLQTAVVLELYTIPLYLFAAYSIKPDPSSANDGLAASAILGIVRQEMKHLVLAGNILRSIGGKPCLYGPDTTPTYPRRLFHGDTVDMELKRATKENIDMFVKLEAPSTEDDDNTPILSSTVLPTYTSISNFYDRTLAGLQILDDEAYRNFDKTSIFDSTMKDQFIANDGSYYGQGIKDITSAADALQIVITEGDLGPASHWLTFRDLRDDPVKYPLDCYPVVENPVTRDYILNLAVYPVMLASDAVYSYLLMSIEKMWQYDGVRRKDVIRLNLISLMTQILSPFGRFLVTLEIPNSSEGVEHFNAAAPFNFYPFPVEELSPYEQLQILVKAALLEYPEATNPMLVGVQQAVDGLIDLAKL